MTAASWITFALVAGFVWGGFACLVVAAMRKERTKSGGAGRDRAP